MKYYMNFKRGTKDGLPEHSPLGEPLFCTDTLELYIGMGSDKPPIRIGIIDPDHFESILRYYALFYGVHLDQIKRPPKKPNPPNSIIIYEDGPIRTLSYYLFPKCDICSIRHPRYLIEVTGSRGLGTLSCCKSCSVICKINKESDIDEYIRNRED